jgi:hypothetical protein
MAEALFSLARHNRGTPEKMYLLEEEVLNTVAAPAQNGADAQS